MRLPASSVPQPAETNTEVIRSTRLGSSSRWEVMPRPAGPVWLLASCYRQELMTQDRQPTATWPQVLVRFEWSPKGMLLLVPAPEPFGLSRPYPRLLLAGLAREKSKTQNQTE